jgi:hypothetical protein
MRIARSKARSLQTWLGHGALLKIVREQAGDSDCYVKRIKIPLNEFDAILHGTQCEGCSYQSRTKQACARKLSKALILTI